MNVKAQKEKIQHLNFGFDLTFELWNLTFSIYAAFPELPKSLILDWTVCLIASRPGPKIFRGSNSSGLLVRTSRMAPIKLSLRSVSILILAMPNETAF